MRRPGKAAKTTGRQVKEQQRLFWRWYYGDCKEQLRGPFKAVVETFERIEGAYVQRYGRRGSKALAWDGFEADVFVSYILRSCSKLSPELIELKMWDRYKVFMEADNKALHEGLLKPLFDYEYALALKEERLEAYRRRVKSARPRGRPRKEPKINKL